MKQLQRLLVQQGHKCFFCGKPIPVGEASVEHLDALSNGGEKTDQNCVACCRAINTALGNLSIKDKFRAILSQPIPFPCPHESPLVLAGDAENAPTNLVAQAVAMLKRYGDKVPRRKNTLFNALRGEVPEVTDARLEALFSELTAQGIIAMSGIKVTYPGLADEA
jgi:HNH endonuclease